jgi:hypothetical protein
VQTLYFQQFGDAIDAARLPLGTQFHGDPPRAIAAIVVPEDVADQRHQGAIALLAWFPVPSARRSSRRG